jgi:hypothetical protein
VTATSHIAAQDESIGRRPAKTRQPTIWAIQERSASISYGSPEAAPLVLCRLIGDVIEDITEEVLELTGAERPISCRAEDESSEAR